MHRERDADADVAHDFDPVFPRTKMTRAVAAEVDAVVLAAHAERDGEFARPGAKRC